MSCKLRPFLSYKLLDDEIISSAVKKCKFGSGWSLVNIVKNIHSAGLTHKKLITCSGGL